MFPPLPHACAAYGISLQPGSLSSALHAVHALLKQCQILTDQRDSLHEKLCGLQLEVKAASRSQQRREQELGQQLELQSQQADDVHIKVHMA